MLIYKEWNTNVLFSHLFYISMSALNINILKNTMHMKGVYPVENSQISTEIKDHTMTKHEDVYIHNTYDWYWTYTLPLRWGSKLQLT